MNEIHRSNRKTFFFFFSLSSFLHLIRFHLHLVHFLGCWQCEFLTFVCCTNVVRFSIVCLYMYVTAEWTVFLALVYNLTTWNDLFSIFPNLISQFWYCVEQERMSKIREKKRKISTNVTYYMCVSALYTKCFYSLMPVIVALFGNGIKSNGMHSGMCIYRYTI